MNSGNHAPDSTSADMLDGADVAFDKVDECLQSRSVFSRQSSQGTRTYRQKRFRFPLVSFKIAFGFSFEFETVSGKFRDFVETQFDHVTSGGNQVLQNELSFLKYKTKLFAIYDFIEATISTSKSVYTFVYQTSTKTHLEKNRFPSCVNKVVFQRDRKIRKTIQTFWSTIDSRQTAATFVPIHIMTLV